MTLTAPAWLQNGESYTAREDRLANTDLIFETAGVIAPHHMNVVPDTGTTLTITSGSAVVPGPRATAWHGMYAVTNIGNDSVVLDPADPTYPRIDRIVLRVYDSETSGTRNEAVFEAIKGTASNTPVAPATPGMAISLATVEIPRGAAAITAGNITTTGRQRAMVNRFIGGGTPIVTAGEQVLLANQVKQGEGISQQRPLVVWRSDAPAGQEIQFTTNGTVWTAANTAPLPGDVTVIGRNAGLRGGYGAEDPKWLIQGGTAAQKSNHKGDARVRFDKPFPNGLLTVQVSNGHMAAGQFYYHLNPSGYGSYLDSFVYKVVNHAGDAWENVQHRINWFAMGW